jgi:hypothetical protein
MRPNKKGLWLFKTSHDELRAINIDENLRTPLHDSIEQFESIFEGFEWLGRAFPQKKVDRYRVFSEEITGRNYWGDHYSNGYRVGYRKDNAGTWIRYDDVKEYLLNGMEPFETDGCVYANPEDNEE